MFYPNTLQQKENGNENEKDTISHMDIHGFGLKALN